MPLLTSSGWTPEALAWGVLLLAVAGKVMVTVRKAGGGCVAGDQPQLLSCSCSVLCKPTHLGR